MSPFTRLFLATTLALLIAAFVSAAPIMGQSTPAADPPCDTVAARDTLDAYQFEPYATNRSIAYHLLAAPAYVVHGVTRPLGWAVMYAEQNVPRIFAGERPPRGVFPMVEFGGPTRVMGGLVLYDNQLFGSDHQARARVLYGGSDTFEGGARYRVPGPFGEGTRFLLDANLFSQPRDEFFLDGNNNDLASDRLIFSRDQLDVTASLGFDRPNSLLATQFDLLYEHVDTERRETTAGSAPTGLGSVHLLTPRVAVSLDFTKGLPRTYRGTELVLQLDYSHDLTSDQYRYGRYVAEVRQYLPVGIFPNTRRLALRARLEQVHPIFGGDDVPFYQRPWLGGQTSLRGFRYRRFQNDGSLVLNAEYRYPIWMNWDAVIFADAGQVFDALGDVAAERFRWSYGGGIHLLTKKGLSFRFEVAGSTDGVRTVLTVQPTFRRVAR